MKGLSRHVRCLLAITLCVATGCGDNRGLVPVRGRVTFGGGDPPAPGVLYFVPTGAPAIGPETPGTPRAGSAIFRADGRFQTTTFRDGDGMRPGVYEVRLVCETAPPDADVNPGGFRDHVPKGFKPPPLEVPTNRRAAVVYDVDVPTTVR